MGGRGRVHPRAALTALVLMLCVLAAGAWLLAHRQDPSRISQKSLYRLGTESGDARMRPLPRPRRVLLSDVKPYEVVGAAIAYLPLPWQNDYAWEVQGYYDPSTRDIHIIGVLPRLEASVDDARLQGLFRHAVRHEYGHAFLDDWVRSQNRSSAALLDFSASAREIDPAAYPLRLRPAVREYQQTVPSVFGSAYFTSNFYEFMAEAYARFLENDPLPAEVRRFFQKEGEW